MIAIAATAILTYSCKKTMVPEEMNAATAVQNDAAESAGAGSGVYVSAADTGAAIKNLHLYSFLSFQNIVPSEYASNAKDGNGILYNKATDELYKLRRKNKTLYVFSNASSLTDHPIPSRLITDN